ncbi:MAG: hypothetical protein HND50_19885 [Calditrichaeota bacterium]|nr:hypothetical protein [Calditrichota bacterium]
MEKDKSFWAMISIVVFLVGQTLSLFNWDLKVEFGLQESEQEVGKVGIVK